MNIILKNLASEDKDVKITLLKPLSQLDTFQIVYLVEVDNEQKAFLLRIDVPPIIESLLEKGMQVTLTTMTNANTVKLKGIAYRISGFAKANYLYIEEDEESGKLTAVGRYHNTPKNITSFDDVLQIARECHQYNPDYGISDFWYPYFDEKGWIKKQQTYVI